MKNNIPEAILLFSYKLFILCFYFYERILEVSICCCDILVRSYYLFYLEGFSCFSSEIEQSLYVYQEHKMSTRKPCRVDELFITVMVL